MVEALGAGSRLGSYRIEGVIGRGGMGVVYRATQERLSRPVALKVIAPELARDARFRRRFDRESELAASIEHPNAVPVYEAGETPDGTLYIAMRMIEGTDLRALLSSEQWLEPARAVRLVDQVAGALDEAHSRGLVHRDVKPSNVLVGQAGGREWAYLTDFGLTKRATGTSELTGSGEWVGTLDYSSPEQIQGKPVDARTDVYALGCVLFEAIAGRVPFERDDEVAKVYAHLNDPPPHLSELTPEAPSNLEPVLERALAKDPEERFPSAGDLARAASATIEGTAITEPERIVARGRAAPGGSAKTRVLRRRGKWLRPSIAVAAIAALIAVTAAIVLLSGGGESGTPVTTEIPVGDQPVGIAVGGGFVWVTNEGDGTVSRIDPKTSRTVGDPIRVGAGPVGITVGDRYVWVTNEADGTVSRISPDSGRVVGVPVRVGVRPAGLTIGAGYVWVADVGGDSLSRLDRSSGQPLGPVTRVGHSPAGVAVGEGSVWVANSGDGTVSRVATGSGDVVGGPIRVGARPRGITVDEGLVWVANSLDGSVSRFDPLSPATSEPATRVGKRPASIAAGDGSIWIANELDGTVSRIDPGSGQVVGNPIDVGGRPRGVATDEGAVWVANSGDDSVTRIEP